MLESSEHEPVAVRATKSFDRLAAAGRRMHRLMADFLTVAAIDSQREETRLALIGELENGGIRENDWRTSIDGQDWVTIHCVPEKDVHVDCKLDGAALLCSSPVAKLPFGIFRDPLAADLDRGSLVVQSISDMAVVLVDEDERKQYERERYIWLAEHRRRLEWEQGQQEQRATQGVFARSFSELRNAVFDALPRRLSHTFITPQPAPWPAMPTITLWTHADFIHMTGTLAEALEAAVRGCNRFLMERPISAYPGRNEAAYF